ncbi:B-cell CLL/lymphoma 9 protein isoform X2 [Denticeps clupeoides]|uniref:B-cell CLL/lymphoma 9 protein isoform X2 n=1 Tax=Denticeps clupeoides TaxID=299321 RepID=UPI0010A501EC|nr:B-cell CLL/lymphoma 9 protein-like isoform X2 [Denticeps clupeoides]
MLESQEERTESSGTGALGAGTATTGAFGRKERAREREEGHDSRSSPAARSTRAKAAVSSHAHTHTTPSPHQHSNTPPVSLGLSSMHSSNPKVRNSPSTNTQSPKSKQEAMVRSPPVMSPSSAAQMDSKLPNQGKQGGTGSQSQSSPCDPKSLSGGHAPKGPQVPVGNMGLKNGQSLNAGNGTKSKIKRERSTSMESFEQRDTGTPNNDGDQKELGSRAKRLCVAERRQPYRGTDWCSGGESDEEDKNFFNCNSSEMKPDPGVLASSTPTHNAVGGQPTASELGSSQKPGSKVFYVFTTEMANKAADAVITGHADNIIAYHMNNISNGKGNKSQLPVNNQMGPLRNDPKQPGVPPQQQQQTSSQSSEQNHQPTPKATAPGPQQPTQPAQPQQPAPGAKSTPGIPQDGTTSGGLDSKSLPSSSPQDGASHDSISNPAGTPGNQTSGNPQQQHGNFPFMDLPKGADVKLTAQHHQQLAHELMSSMSDNSEGLSQEQLEHRERSLQTLRDIQRMLFPDDKDMGAMGPQGNMGGPPPNTNPLMEGGGGPKKLEQGPLQAMMTQSQNLGKPGGPRPDGPPFGPPGPRDMPFSPSELGPPPGPPMNAHPGGEHGDHMTPEQMAWLKLQQEFYEEKKRKQEQMQHRPMGDMMLHQHGPRGMIRGPPPPYQINPGEVWGPGGPEPFPDQMNMGPRGMHPHMQRMPGFPGMMNPDMEGGPNPMPRPGMNWPDDMPKMGDVRGFPPGQGMFGGPGGRVERFPNPQSVQEAMFHQGMGEKQGMGLPPGMMIEMNRMIGNQRPMEPGNGAGMMFPRMPTDGPMSPNSRMEFMKGLGRDMGEFGMGPGNMNVNIGPNPQMMSSKMREPPMNISPEEMMKMRGIGGGGGAPLPENMGPQPKMMQGPPFPDQPHPGDFNMGPSRQFPGMMQQCPPGNAGRGPRGEPPFCPDQRPNTGGNGRLSHMPPNQPSNSGPAPPPPNQRNVGRKPSDLSVQSGPANSPSVNPLKSPTLRQVQSPMLGSPSGNLKSPQTPSQLAGMLTGPSAAVVAAATASIKSPQMMGSAGASPVHMKSPSLPAPSPGWTSSPKPPMQSPGIPQNSKPQLSMTSPNMMGSVEQGGNLPPVAPPSSSSSNQAGSMNVPPGSLPSSSPYTIPPEPTLSQNPLSIMMSRMSKFAMPSSTPLYHDAIKTVASSDDDSPPARSPNLPSLNNMSGMGVNHHTGHPRMMTPNSSGPMPSLSPMGMNTMGSQPLSHGMPNQMPSPNPMGPNMPPHPGPMGPGGMIPHGMMMPPVSQDAGMGNNQMLQQGRMGLPPHRGQGFPPGQSPPQQVPFPHNGPVPQGGGGSFPHGMGFQGDGGPLGRMGPNMPHGPGGGEPGMCKPNTPGGQDFNSMSGVFSDSDLHEVMRPGASGIPEFDLSRIIPSEKPSQTLSYFPRGGGDAPGGKPPPHPTGPPGFPQQIQGMMGEGNPRMGLPMQGMGGPPPGPGHMGPQDMPMGNPGHNPMRPQGFMGQGMMGPQHRMLSPGQQPGMMGGPGMMQGKERVPLYSHPGPVGSPNMMMSLQGMGGPQQTMMMSQMRPRGMAADMGMGFNPGPGNPGNIMF